MIPLVERVTGEGGRRGEVGVGGGRVAMEGQERAI